MLKQQNPFECLEVEKLKAAPAEQKSANKRAAELKKQAGKRVTTEMLKDARPQIVDKARGGYAIFSTLAILLLVAASFTVGLQLTVTSLTSTDVAAAAVQIAPVSSTFGSSNFGECNLISTDANVRSQPNRSALQQTLPPVSPASLPTPHAHIPAANANLLIINTPRSRADPSLSRSGRQTCRATTHTCFPRASLYA